jgi:FKBP-type peptidyl-prolyl cis-trans isomerase FkpA
VPSSRRVAGIALSCVLVLLAGCDKPTSPTGVTALSSTDVKLGSGAEAASGNTLSMNYTVWLFDVSKTDQKGLQVETSVGGDPFSFTLGSGTVIKGWDQGLVGMRVGGLRRLVVPPSLGYGAERHNAIPPYATLVFDIELLSVQ